MPARWEDDTLPRASVPSPADQEDRDELMARIGQRHRALLTERHLDVAAGDHGLHRIAQAEREVRDHEAVEAPLLAQDRGEQRRVLPQPRKLRRRDDDSIRPRRGAVLLRLLPDLNRCDSKMK